MNKFTDIKCYNFGKLIPREWKGTWEDMIESGEWVLFATKHKLSVSQIEIIQRGFHGDPFEVEQDMGDNIMPFGTHKGKKLKDLPDRYITWLSEQHWLGKWADLCLYVKKHISETEEKELTKEEIANILKF